MRLLVTNDDGILAPGLAALAAALSADGHDVIVAAPRDDRTGSGAAVGPVHLLSSTPVERIELASLPGVPAYGVDGPPVLSVFAGCLGALGEPPHAVVSGINPGPNLGGSVLHSGTVAGPITAANFGLRGLAVSIMIGEPIHWATAARLACRAVSWLAKAAPGTVLSLNVPNAPEAELRGVRSARLAHFGGFLRTALSATPAGGLAMELLVERTEHEADTDAALLAKGFATLTALTGISAAPDISDAAADAFAKGTTS